MTASPRMRMVAGPNGSGKSTLVREILDLTWIGYYLNPDELQKALVTDGYLDLERIGVPTSEEELVGYFQNSSFLKSVNLAGEAQNISCSKGTLYFASIAEHPGFAYFVSVLADFIRRKLVEQRVSFTFETVMSSYDKVNFLKDAKRSGYRTYLYYISTKDADINVARVDQRVREQGHSVPENKIRERYTRSLDHLLDAIWQVDRAYVFDNSGNAAQLLAEINEDERHEKVFTLHADILPLWFKKAVIEKLAS